MNYDYLRSADTKSGSVTSFSLLGIPFDVVANIPIGFLDVSGETRSIVVDNAIVSRGEVVCKLKTLGELVSFGYSKLNYCLRTGYRTQKRVSNIIYEIQVALAKYSLKLKGTDFTVFDIKVEDLNLSSEALSFVKEKFDAETLGDLYIGYKSMKKQLGSVKNGADIKSSIKSAMLEFGTKPEVDGSLSLNAIKKEKEVLEKLISESKEKAFPSILKNAGYSVSKPLSSFEWTSGKQYNSSTKCNYSGLLEKLRFQFLTEEEILPAIGIDEGDLERIKTGSILSIETLSKICKYFNEPIEKLVKFNDEKLAISNSQILDYQIEQAKKKEGISSKQPEKEDLPEETRSVHAGPFNYSPLLERISKATSGDLGAFMKSLPMTWRTLHKIREGKPISPKVISAFAEFFKCKPEDLFTCSIEALKEFSAEDMKTEEERYKDKECNYAGLKLRLSAVLSNITKMAEDLSFPHTVTAKISCGERLSDDVLWQIAAYLKCSVKDIVSYNPSFSNGENFEAIRNVQKLEQEEIQEDVLCDYSGLFKLMKQRGVNKQRLGKESLVHGYIFTYQINKGLPISKIYLVRLCMYFGCTEEDLVTYKRMSKQEQPQSHVNLNYGSGVARVKPASVQGMQVEQPGIIGSQNSGVQIVPPKDESSSGGVASGGRHGNKPKFYMGKRGFLNLGQDRVKLHKDVQDFEQDIEEKIF